MTRVLALLAGFALAVGIRVAVGGVGVAQSASAGLVFAACLSALGLAAGARVGRSARDLGWGSAGALIICAPVLVSRLVVPAVAHGTDGFLRWAVVVSVVAAAEEYFLRGALYDAVAATRLRVPGAVVVTAVAFAALHVPLYGWHVLPLDLAVGVVLGMLRERAGSATAPAIAHVGADLVSWFVR